MGTRAASAEETTSQGTEAKEATEKQETEEQAVPGQRRGTFCKWFKAWGSMQELHQLLLINIVIVLTINLTTTNSRKSLIYNHSIPRLKAVDDQDERAKASSFPALDYTQTHKQSLHMQTRLAHTKTANTHSYTDILK